MSAPAETTTPKRGRGRPPKTHDNRRVQAALVPWYIHGGSVVDDPGDGDEHPASLTGMSWLDDIITGVSRMQTEGQKSTRPLDRRLILRILLRCPTIGSASVWAVAGRDYEKAQTDRYTAAARVASKGVAMELDRRPEWVARLEADAAYMEEFDGPMTEH